ncbi:porin [Piscinibacter sp.]|uniref:porin n=1 Tax=Piscinibacter sp. TaxID=1903157 RepID=UPI002C9E5DE9|nr:porin [Albitalea sp.]HUG24440.1 porin [Albitalea sp.]
MIRSLTLLAAAALCCAAAQAQNQLQIFGLLDMSAGQFQDAGAERVVRVDSGRLSTSFIGFKGSNDLGGGLKSIFAIEHFLRVDRGAAGRFDGEAFWARNAYVGLSGAFGTSVLGRNTTPLFVSTLLFNAFGDSFGFSPSIRQLFAPAVLPFFGDTAWNNSLSYASNDNDGFTINLIANLGEGVAGVTGRNHGANLMYFSGPLGATFAWQKVRNGAVGTPPGWAGQTTWQFGASYDLEVAKLFGQVTDVETAAAVSTETRLWSFGTSVPIGPGKVLAQYGHATAKTPVEVEHTTFTLGYDMALSKTTDVYGVFMADKVTGLSTGKTVAAGMRLRF